MPHEIDARLLALVEQIQNAANVALERNGTEGGRVNASWLKYKIDELAAVLHPQDAGKGFGFARRRRSRCWAGGTTA